MRFVASILATAAVIMNVTAAPPAMPYRHGHPSHSLQRHPHHHPHLTEKLQHHATHTHQPVQAHTLAPIDTHRNFLRRDTIPPIQRTNREVELYTPLYTMRNPLSWSHEKTPNASLQCNGLGPQCMDFPLGAPRNQTVGVRAYCAAVIRPRLNDDNRPLTTTTTTTDSPSFDNDEVKVDPTPLPSYDIRPIMMSPCAKSSECVVTIQWHRRPIPWPPAPRDPENGRRKKGHHAHEPPSGTEFFENEEEVDNEDEDDIVNDDWVWFEDENGNIPALRDVDVSSWLNLTGLVFPQRAYREEAEEEEDSLVEADNDDGQGDNIYLGNFYTEDVDDDDDDMSEFMTIPHPIPMDYYLSDDDGVNNNEYDDALFAAIPTNIPNLKSRSILTVLPEFTTNIGPEITPTIKPRPEPTLVVPKKPWFTFSCEVEDNDVGKTGKIGS